MNLLEVIHGYDNGQFREFRRKGWPKCHRVSVRVGSFLPTAIPEFVTCSERQEWRPTLEDFKANDYEFWEES